MYFVGNGADLNFGLESRASVIVDAYRRDLESRLSKQPNLESMEDYAREWLLAALSDTVTYNWATFELSFGVFSGACEERLLAVQGGPACPPPLLGLDPADLFEAAYDDFALFLNAWLKKEEPRFKSEILPGANLEGFYQGVLQFLMSGLTPQDQQLLEKHMRKREVWAVDFCVFNYTSCLDSILEACRAMEAYPATYRYRDAAFQKVIGDVLHVHGTIDDQIIVEADNPRQLVSAVVRASDSVKDFFLKRECNERTGTLRESTFSSLLSAAGLVCIYGMSLGKTDACRWRSVLDWLLASPRGRVVVIAAREKEVRSALPHKLIRKRAAVVERFLAVAGTSPEEKAAVEGSIIVSLNPTELDI